MIKVTWAVGVFTLLCGLVSIIAPWLAVLPLRRRWNSSQQSTAEIARKNNILLFGDIALLITDFVIFSLPLKTLLGLKLIDRNKKIGMIATFMLGFLYVCHLLSFPP